MTLAPDWFERIAAHEEGFGRTIQRSCSIRTLADRGRPYRALVAQPDLARRALQHAWDEPVRVWSGPHFDRTRGASLRAWAYA